MKNFEWNFFEVIPREFLFFDTRYTRMTPIIQVSGGSNKEQKGATITYSRIKFNLTWPVTLQLHADVVDYLEGAYLPRHADLLPKLPGEEYRIAIVLKEADSGGVLLADRFIMNTRFLKIFNTRTQHEVTKVEKGTRRVLLLGIYFSLVSPIGR
ncbi:MAG: hypothetical protein KBC50_03645 [Candidatus Pacebacteria bacterium]|nr:hypothetical protein [Candidatus Paceibacterota bacterium]TXI11713.1 MAG: hypothetical protein E6Q68_05440 [Polynucleobacter sp.]